MDTAHCCCFLFLIIGETESEISTPKKRSHGNNIDDAVVTNVSR